MTIALGTPAPDFTLEDTHGTPVSLSGLRGSPVLLVFFPHAFTPTCTAEWAELGDLGASGGIAGLTVLGICCDPSPALRVFARHEDIGFALLSDFWPHGEVARAYAVFLEQRGIASRGSFLVDGDGVVRWALVNGPGEARDTTAYASALAALRWTRASGL